VYILCTIDPAGDAFLFLVKFLGLYVVGAGVVIGVLGFLGGIIDSFERRQKKRAEAAETIAMEARDEDENAEEEDGERVEAEDQQEMVELLTAQRSYATSDDIV